jgi:DeoR family fructose operon transcriptional repressor
MSMLPEERQQLILRELRRRGKVHVTDLAGRMGVTPETVRRDLAFLEAQKLLKRVYGGAVPFAEEKAEPHFELKMTVMHREKAAIGKKAAERIRDHDRVVLDVGTTTLELARSIRNVDNVTIVTNSLAAAVVLNERLEKKLFSGKVIILGGISNPFQRSISGGMTCEMLRNLHFDKAFLSCGGITPEEVTDYDLEESLASSLMAERSREVYLLADHTKLGRRSFHPICPLEQVDAVICDQDMPPGWNISSLKWIVAREEESDED